MPYSAFAENCRMQHDGAEEDEDTYDSEEERFKERVQNMQRNRQVQADAARQRETLRQHRTEQEAARRMNYGGVPFLREALAEPHIPPEPADDETVLQHERQWAEFEARFLESAQSAPSTALITLKHIPWPPFEGDMRRFLIHLAHSGSCQTTSLRRAYTKLCLRWHPDKFQHRFAKLIVPADLAAILERVHQISQDINVAWSQVQEQDGAEISIETW